MEKYFVFYEFIWRYLSNPLSFYVCILVSQITFQIQFVVWLKNNQGFFFYYEDMTDLELSSNMTFWVAYKCVMKLFAF